MNIPKNCIECPDHKMIVKVGELVRVVCYGGLRPKAKPLRIKEHVASTPRWCPKKRYANAKVFPEEGENK